MTIKFERDDNSPTTDRVKEIEDRRSELNALLIGNLDIIAAEEKLSAMDSGFWTRGGHTSNELITAIVKAAIGGRD